MTDRRPRWILAGIVLALGAIGVWRLWPAPSAEATAPTATAPAKNTEAPEAARPANAAAPAAATAARAPLPAPGTPVAQIVGPLKARADAGDSRAACRLAIELLRCVHVEQARQIPTFDGVPADESLARRGALDAADRFAEMEIRRIRLGQQCEAVDPALLAQAPRYLAEAARAGEPEAMLRYATGAHHGVLGDGFVRDPELARWRQESPAMLLRAAQAGRPEAVHLLGYAYRSDGAPFAALIADDPVQAHAWAVLQARLSGSARPAFKAADASVEVQATALAGEWHARYFNNAALGPDRARQLLMPLDSPFVPPADERFCE